MTAEFQAYVDSHRPKGDFIMALFAAEIVAGLRIEAPDVLSKWLDANAEQFVTNFLGTQDRIRRGRQAHAAPAKAFNEAADRYAQGDQDALSPYDDYFVINEDNLRRRVGDMFSGDHMYVASKHIERSNSALFEAAFHKAVAKRIPPGKTTADVMTDDEYLRLRKSCVRR